MTCTTSKNAEIGLYAVYGLALPAKCGTSEWKPWRISAFGRSILDPTGCNCQVSIIPQLDILHGFGTSPQLMVLIEHETWNMLMENAIKHHLCHLFLYFSTGPPETSDLKHQT